MAKIKKKGIFFTFIAITIMVVFIVIFTPQADVSLQKDTQSIKKRVATIDTFINSLENVYFESVLRSSSYKTILSLILYVNKTDSFLIDLDSAFSEVILNGTINNFPIDAFTEKNIMDNNTLTNWTKRIIKISKDTLDLDTTITINNVTIYQVNPWNIESRLSINFTIKSNVAEWKKNNVIITASNSIEGLHDPSYLVNTNGLYDNKIKKSSVETNKWNLSHVGEHLRNGTYVYRENSKAPSFLMRFVNDTTNSSCCGIESLIDPNKITSSDQIESYVDYHFWNHTFANKCIFLFNITGLWNEFRYFKLDIEHVVLYNITPQDLKPTCL